MNAADFPRKTIGQQILDLAMAATVLTAEGYTVITATAHGFGEANQVQIAYDRRLEALITDGKAIRQHGPHGAHIEWLRDGYRIVAVAPDTAPSA